VKHDLLPANPITGIKPDYRKSETNDRDSYTPDELQALFTSRIYTGPAKATEFWLPLLGLFTGARLNELGQLAVSDVDVGGPVPSITIDDRSDDPEVVKRLKNKQSRRVVPIHPKLMELGLGEFVRAAQGTPLFPELPRQAKVGPECTAAFSKWFGRYLKEVGIKRPRLAAAHSLRHTFVEACDNCGVNPKVTSALVGHSSGDAGAGSAMTRRYGGGTKLPMLRAEILKVQFEGFPDSLRKWGKGGH